MPRTLSKDEIERYLSAVANVIGTVDKSVIRVNLLVRKEAGELNDSEYNQLMEGLNVDM